MELKQYLSITRRWLWLIALCAILATVGAYFFSSRQTPIYAAESVVLLDTTNVTDGTFNYSDLVLSERLARTYAQLFTTRESEERTLETLGYEPEILRYSVEPQRDTTLITVRIESDDPEAAAFVANELPGIVSSQLQARQVVRYGTTKANLQEQLSVLEEEISALRQREDQLLASNEGETQLAEVRTSLSLKETTYEALLSDLSQITLAEAQEADVISIVERAELPDSPISPRVLRNSVLAAFVGLLTGLGAAFLLSYLDSSVKEDSPLDELFGVAPLATIARIDGESDRTLITRGKRGYSDVSEAYRILRTNIRFSMVDEAGSTLMVTSPGPAEGKSTTAANLAVVLAQAGARTILIDADLRRPVQHEIFRVSNYKGLTNALIEREQSARDFLSETEIPDLLLLPSGPIPPNPSELLASKRMTEVLQELEESADTVIIDTPPVLVVTDSSVVAGHTSGVVLVVRANKTSIDATRRAISQLTAVNADMLGLVMNDARRNGQEYYYYYASSESGPQEGWMARLRERLLGRARREPADSPRASSR